MPPIAGGLLALWRGASGCWVAEGRVVWMIPAGTVPNATEATTIVYRRVVFVAIQIPMVGPLFLFKQPAQGPPNPGA